MVRPAQSRAYLQMGDVQAGHQCYDGRTYDDHAGAERTFTAVDAAVTAIGYLDRSPDATYPTHPGMQRRLSQQPHHS
jgi:hypothetical protein